MNPPDTAKKVSVVVPVYNTEAFLAQCLDSLTGQTLDDIEIVVVNDGSPDGSQAIIDDYAARFPGKIVALTKPNGGLGSARNLGIERATGRYIGFVDSDDFVEPDMYRHLYEEAERTTSDVAICRYRHYALDGSYDVVGGNFPFEEGDVFPSEGFFLNSRVMIVVNKIYRAELVRRVPFQDTWFEDVAWSPVAMSHADRICYTPNVYYHYIMREGTITTSHDDARTLQEVSALRWALANANPERADQVGYMAARRLLFDAEVRPAYADKFALAIHELRGVIGASPHVLDDPALYLAVRPYLDADFATIPKTILFSGTGRPDTPGDSWRDRLAFPVDATYVDVDGLIAADPLTAQLADDPLTARLASRPAVLRDYLTLRHIAEHGGVAIDDHLLVLGPIAWALSASRSFFGFESPSLVSRRVYGAVAGAAVITDLLALFAEHLSAPDPLAEALDRHFLRSGRVAWDYATVEADFAAPYAELDDGCRVYATSVFSNDFGLGRATTSLQPTPVTDDDGEVVAYQTSPSYHEIAQRIALDYARWLSSRKTRRRPAAARATLDPPDDAEPATPSRRTHKVRGTVRRLPVRAVGLVRKVLRRGAAAEPVPEPRVFAGPGPDGLRVLLYVGGFTTASSSERAHLMTTWLRGAFGPDTEVSVLFTDRGNPVQAERAASVAGPGVRVLVVDDESVTEWSRALGPATFDLVVVATPKGGGPETSLLASAPAGTRVLCRLGKGERPGIERSFDVVVDKLSDFHRWVENRKPT